jgi:general secretion pathway protein B
MSYILDALRKSESERRQGRVPDLGQQVQLIRKPRKKSSALAMWIGAGLVLNAAVLAFVFWPSSPEIMPQAGVTETPEPAETAKAIEASEPKESTETTEATERQQVQAVEEVAERPDTPNPEQDTADQAQIELVEPPEQERPTIIVPSSRNTEPTASPERPIGFPESVPHLVELPLDFQKSIPDLVFNSHIYASDPASRRVMINNNYLRPGDSFSGIRVERITEEGVVLSRNNRPFRVGIVRDWVSPE